jgi:hypothetical protein
VKLHLRHLSAPAPWLRRYFSSGWAFLIPYLAAYLLYYWLKWPVNPADAGVKVRVASESGTWVPCLLHVYWILHAVNVGLAAVALVSWWREQEAGDRSQETEVRSQESEDGRLISDHLTQRREDAKEEFQPLHSRNWGCCLFEGVGPGHVTLFTPAAPTRCRRGKR